MINLVEILKHCPKGMKLYSPIFGEVKFLTVFNNEYIDTYTSVADIHRFQKDGRFDSGGECMLFPSKRQKDWYAFQISVKRGDIMMLTDKSAVFIVDTMRDNYIKTIAYVSKHSGFRVGERIFLSYIPASEDMKEKLFKAMDKAGYTWDGETLKKKEYQFKPFDKVLVRDKVSVKWKCAFYSHFEPSSAYPHVTASSGTYAMCIPFEGNEHLVGTTKNP